MIIRQFFAGTGVRVSNKQAGVDEKFSGAGLIAIENFSAESDCVRRT